MDCANKGFQFGFWNLLQGDKGYGIGRFVGLTLGNYLAYKALGNQAQHETARKILVLAVNAFISLLSVASLGRDLNYELPSEVIFAFAHFVIGYFITGWFLAQPRTAVPQAAALQPVHIVGAPHLEGLAAAVED